MSDLSQSAPPRRSAYLTLVLLISSSILLQKIALPGTGNALPISTVLMPLIIIVAWFRGMLIVRPNSFLILSTFLLCGIVSFLLNASTNQVSIAALFLVAFIQFPLMFELRGHPSDGHRAEKFFLLLMFVLSILGAAQFLCQGIAGADIAFFVDRQLPADLIVKTYHNLNPLFYGADAFKSNGIFFAEPSFFSQFIAIAIIIELLNRHRIIRLFGYAAGLICSYSGTGIIILAVFGIVYTIQSGRGVIIVAGGIAVVAIIFFGDVLQIDLITSRIDEFSTPNTSGHARFISIFALLADYGLSDVVSILFGKGPGTITDFFPLMPFEMFDPTWGKLLFEYGGVSFIVYVFFILSFVGQRRNPLCLPLLLMYFFAGGYLVDASIVSLILVFLSLSINDENVSSGSSTPHLPLKPATRSLIG